ncbi:MAG TPA: hypothetical protein DCQ31_16915 [Bacteroidales bacterium]|nr:hypothetical protein [Bacteroidales bacterium]
MKLNYLLPIVLVLFLFGTSCKEEKKPHKITKDEISIFIDQWHKDAANANTKAYFEKISNTGIFIGTDPEEHWTKQAFYGFSSPYFENKKTWNFYAIDRNIFFSNDSSIVWFDEILNTWMGKCRSSGVIQLQNDSLKIEHYQLSVTVPNPKMTEFLELMRKENTSKLPKDE